MLAPELVMSLVGFDVAEVERLLQLPKRTGYYRIKKATVLEVKGLRDE